MTDTEQSTLIGGESQQRSLEQDKYEKVHL